MEIKNKLDKKNIEEIMSLTSTQEGMLFEYISDPNSEKYHEQLSLSLSGDIKLELVQKSWDFVIETNEMLRAIYRWKNIDKPVQIILKNHKMIVKYHNLSEVNEDEKILQIKNIKQNDIKNKLDITNETLRVYLCKINDNKYEMIISNHHILYDGWSNGIILKEFMEVYKYYFHGKNPVKQIKSRFKEFIKCNHEIDKSKQKLYWEDYLKGFENRRISFNADIRDDNKKFSGKHKYEICTLTKNKLETYAKEIQVSSASVLYIVWAILKQKLENTEDVVFGMTVSGRNAKIKDIGNMVGLFINTIPLRIKTGDEETVKQLIKRTDRSIKEAEEFENTPLVDIKEYSNIKNNENMFDSIVVIENYPLDFHLNENEIFKIEQYSIEESTSYNLTLGIMLFDKIELEFGYNNQIFSDEMVKRLGTYFENILDAIIKYKDIKAFEIEMLTEEEKHKILYEFNDTYVDYPKDKTIHQLFEEQVVKTPDNVAVVFEDKKLTYRELNEKSNRLARTLREKGVKQDSIVGIIVERSIEMIVGIMGILKAGGAYLPIDPEYPMDRIRYMIKDSEVEILLTLENYYNKLEFEGNKINLEDEQYYAENDVNLEIINTSKDLAYVIYTSGSTGIPKGVMIEHKGVSNLSILFNKEIGINEMDKVLQFASCSFDASVWEIFMSLFTGATLVIPTKKTIYEYSKIENFIKNNKITVTTLPPIYALNLNVDKVSNLRILITAGSSTTIELINIWKEKVKYINAYGPTEDTICTTMYEYLDNNTKIKKISIGVPILNNKVYILNDRNKLQAIGVDGQLCICGEGLARGYLNKPDLTAEKFIENPFIDGERMYKTGDLARWLPDGNIEFIGRIDNQVKIRGFRIELGEIENQLLSYEKVKESIVIDRQDKNGDKYLCAYIVSNEEVTVGEIRKHLLKTLPEYMVPSYFIQLEKMPLTHNNKIDRKALPEPYRNVGTGVEYEEARNEVEKTLVEIWNEILGVENIGINHNFFELGGHSLKATSLVIKIHKRLCVEVPIKEIFKSPTIKGISEYIQKIEKNIYEEIKKIEEKEYYEVSSAQKRMYMLQQFDLQSTSYNMPGMLEVEGKLDIQRLESAFNKLIERHETLRTSFENMDGKIVQKISLGIEFKVDYVDIRKTIEKVDLSKEILNSDNYQYEKVINEQIEKSISSFIKAFDLSKAPLLRVVIIKVQETKHIIMFDMHHIISDGVSMGILTKEFTELYAGKELEEIKIQYKDFSAWQNNFLKSEKMKKQQEYWLQNFNDEIPVLNISTDFARPSVQSFEGDNVSFKLDKELTSNLNKIAKETGSTMYMVLLSGVNILLSKYSGQTDIVIGSPIAGRPHADSEKIIGVFVNTLAMRNHPEGSKRYEEFLMEVRETALRAYENQNYQFEELVDNLSIRRDISRNPLFDVMFTMQNMDSSEIELEDLRFVPYKNNNKVAKFDLMFTAIEVDEEILLDISYCTKLFKRETVERIVEHFRNILKAVAVNTSIKLSEIELLSQDEKNKLLYEFNDMYADYPRDKTIQELFEKQVEKTPDNVAVVFEDEKLTYRELNEKSNRLARTLREKGVKQDSIVGIMVERSFDMIVGIMGILKAGGAYLPIDPEYPEDRMIYMLEDSKSNIILTQSKLINKVAFKGVIIDLGDEVVYDHNIKNLDYINEQKDLAYIIYTSGTTGNPKGTMIEHKNVVRLMFNDRMQFDFNEKDVWTMFHSYCFDFSVWEMYGALLYGGKLVLVSKNKARDTEEYLNILRREKVTVLNQIPTPFYKLMNKELNRDTSELKLRYLIFGGEALKPEMLKGWVKKYPEVKLINMYGITETTVHVTFKEIKELDINLKISNIGKPIPTLSTYIMDKNLKLQPIGVPGELCVGGDGVARGYLNKKELTEAKFLTNPYKVEERIYKSGDLARMLSNGEMEYLGRIDYQVKIRGFRIELGEIENQLLDYELIKEVVVIDREDKNREKYLCAYIVCNEEVTVGELREYLLKKLPEYMVPSYFVQLEKMPLTNNGKIDRKVLPEPNGNIATGTEYEGATNEVEEKLVEIWSEILGVENIGINHNFFELGGHSLKATSLISRIHKALNMEIPLKEIFKSPTIKGISEYIQKTEKTIYEEIKLVEEKEYYEVSSAQKRMYMLQQFDLQSTSYNMPGMLEVEGKLDIKKIENAFSKLIERHETLRTSFKNMDGKIVQKISSGIEFKVDYVDIRKTIEEVDLSKEILNSDNYQYEKVINEQIEKSISSFIKAFDLSKAPLLRVVIIKVQETKHIIMFDMHHIISDGVSMGILTKEFTELYAGKELEEIKIQYKDFSAWQNNFLKSEKMKKQQEYWLQNFNDEIAILNIATDFARPSVQSFEGDNISFKLDKELTSNLNKIAKETGSTMYMVLLSGVNILLSKYSGQTDIVIGSPIAGRPHADLEKIIGVFVNTLAMRNHPEGSKRYEEFLMEVRENALRAYENQNYQFEELVDNLSIRRDISRNPLFDVMFTMQNMDSSEIELEDLRFIPYKNNNKVAKFDLMFTAIEVDEEILLDISYCTKLFKRETIERIVEYFKNVLNAVVKNTSIKLSEIEMLSEEEKNKLLYEFNDTYKDYPRDKTIHQLFEEQVEKTPNNIAVVFEDKKLTYRELNEKANRLARILREKGVKQDNIVGIMVERSFNMIVGIMGVLKAGGAYLPIDPEYPEDRVKYMLEDSKTNLLLTQSAFIDKIIFDGVIIDLEDEDGYVKHIKNLESINESKDLAYVIYTSGSTGAPKGVMIEHRSIINTIIWRIKYYNFSESDVVLQIPSFSFDSSVEDIFTPLLSGGKLVLILQEKRLNIEYLKMCIEKNSVGYMLLVPSFYRTILSEMGNSLKNIKGVTVAGQSLYNELVTEHYEKLEYVQLYNEYGPTENSVCTSIQKVYKNDLNITIGKPINNVKCFVVDNNNQMVPIGVSGELCVGGMGLARGYLNKLELTSEKFVKNPFIYGERIYKTGDLAKWLPDGNIEFLGRIDHQVKIRGFRIELGEIESQLLNYGKVKEAVVIDKEDKNGDKYLCSYVVCNEEIIAGELREHLCKTLPEYMVPSYFIQLEKMSLTNNGKIDRQALPEPDGNIEMGTEYEGARNKVEEKLLEIWSEILGVENIGINHNFFELGGHSLKATSLVSKIHKELNVEVPLKKIFKTPTIKGISEYIQSTEKNIYEKIKKVEEKEYYEVSSAQKRMYMLQQFDLQSTSYNMPWVIEVEGNLNIKILENAFNKLIERHETLRTYFENIEGEIVQKISKEIHFKVDYVDVSKTIEEVALNKETISLDSYKNEKVINEEIEKSISSFVKAFDLRKAPLLRVGVIKIEETKHIIMFDMHHIISDGVSMGILTKEFTKLYEGRKLEEIKVQYKDFSAWQNNFLKSEKMKKQEEYWLQRFSDEIPLLNMPTDFTRPSVQSFEGDNISFKLDKQLTSDLNKMAKETGSTMYMVLLSGINILLSKYSGQTDIVIGSPIAGRAHVDLEKIIGMFVNTLAMKNTLQGNKNYKEFLREVKENALKAYENQDYQFEELIEKINVRRDISRNPLFDVMFTMQNIDSLEIELEYLKFLPYKSNNKVSKFDLTFTVVETDEEILVNIAYCTKLFKQETIKRIGEHFKNILKVIVRDISIKLNEIEMTSEEEKNKLLYEFNHTYKNYPRDKTIQELFEEQVEKTPNNIAVIFEDEKLTYKELNEKANRLSITLLEKGVKPGTIVGIIVERCIETVVGIIGVIKTGAAYMPIDPEQPLDRVKYMIEDSNVKILLGQEDTMNFSQLNVDVLNLNHEYFNMKNIINTKINVDENNPIYVIYTSGTTGLPKGVIINNRNLVNYTNWIKNKLNLSEKDKTIIVSSLAFDLSYTGFYSGLLSGCEIHIVKKEMYLNSEFLMNYIDINNITYLKLTPSLFSMLINSSEFLVKNNLKMMRYLILGGEKINIQEVEKFHEIYSHVSIMNHYGPTETTIGSISEIIDFTKLNDYKHMSCIGYPIDNTRVYILDKYLNLLPSGILGEICIAGDGVSNGYINDSKLINEKFICKKFRNKTEMKLYRTGDYGRRLNNGKIEILGRIDNQIKIRGFRVELKEIESIIAQYEFIKEVVVIDREDRNGDKYLCAYIVCNKEVIVSELRKYLLGKLPKYMVPLYYIQLKKIPLTNNGKINAKALLELDVSIESGTEYEGARNEVEGKLVEIWSEVLSVENIGINHNFFELGGHSLKATLLVSKIHKELNVEVPLKEIFKLPTIKGISEYIQSTEKNIYEEIKIVEKKEYYEVSSAQKRMYMLQQFDLQNTTYNMPGVLEVEGKLEIKRLENAFNKLIERHETLRTYFENIEGEIVQKVSRDIEFKVDYVDIKKTIEEATLGKDILRLDSYQNEKGINEEMEKVIGSFIRAFDLNKAPLLRVGVIKVEEIKHIIMFDMHHIISDGVSMKILTKEFTELYEGKNLEKIKIQYKDFSAWQNNLLKSEKIKNQEKYWLQKFNDEIPVLNMSTDYVRPSIQSFEGNNINFKLDKELTRNLNKIAKETGSTMYMVLLSGVNILLSKYSGQEDIVIGSPIAGRPHVDLDKIIGMFVNTLAMRNYPNGSKNYKEFLIEVRENALGAYENQDYQFEVLVEKLNIRRDISRNPLFDVMVTMQNMDSLEIEIEDLKFVPYKNNSKVAKFDLTFTAVETGEETLIEIAYCTKLFKKETVERIADHFKNILKAVVRNTNIKLSEIEMLSQEEKNKLLYEFNDTYVDYPRDKTIHQLFEEQVEKTANNIAIIFKEEKLTYRELNERSNKLARKLREKGVKQDNIVGIMAERSLEMIVGIMGILKAGGAYLPIDPEYPEDRINYMLEDSKTNILLTQGIFANKVIFSGKIIILGNDKEYSENMENLKNINIEKDLAYVIYTSGSIGKPKGVMIEHRNCVNVLNWFINKYNIKSKVNILNSTEYTFDPSVEQIFGTLISGATLCIPMKTDIMDIEKLEKYITINKISILNSVPTIIKELLDNKKKIDTLDTIIVGGEKLENKLKNYILKNSYKLFNHYGPTETTIDALYSLCKENEKVSIGKPISNTKVYILDKNNNIMPIGVQGELYLSGKGLARGYINKPELTSEKFIANPFIPGERMYGTGDLGRWLPDGNIEFIGRIDHQVKIRGFRIELGEIENVLLSYQAIKEAIVIDREDKNADKYLCAYIVCNKESTVGELREYLSKTLPEYMVPSYFIQLEKMPLNSNGKIDRKALPEPDGNIYTGIEYEEARNEVEAKIIEIWSEILGVENIGINHNFFEIGGHSLKATYLVLKIHKELNVEIPIKEIFKSPTIKGISEYIQSTEKNIYEEIKKVEKKEYYEVSSAQKRMYMLQQFDLQNTTYNMPGVLEVEGKLEIKRLENAFNKLIERHETLRTYFENIDGEIIQKISSNINFKLKYVDIGKTIEEAVVTKEMLNLNKEAHEKVINEEIEKLISNFIKAFDLSKAPLLRVGVIKVEETKHIIMFDMHHIISDGVSMGILTKEFTEIYEGKELEQIKVQYKDFSAWQNNFLKSEKMKKQEKYWLQKFSDNIPVLNMSTDFVRPSVQSFEGDNVSFKLDKELTSNLNNIAKETGSTMYMVLLSGVSILLSKYSGQEDIVIGSPIAGRPHVDLDKIIGMFVNTLVMRNYPNGSKNYKEFLIEVRENALGAYENQDYQFEVLVEKLNIRRDISRNPLFDVMVTMQNMDSLEIEIEIEDLKFVPYKNNSKVAKFDLTFTAVETGEETLIEIAYCTKLFKKETVERIADHFKNILKAVVRNTSIKLSEIEILSQEEKNKLLYEFNDTYVDYPRDKTIHQLFEEQVEKTPNNIAIIFKEEKLTYRELNERSNKLARKLREKGVKQDNIVGIMAERSLEMIVGIMGILKAGGAYLPIDPEYPEDRINYMLEDSKTNILLTQGIFANKVIFSGKTIILGNDKEYSENMGNLKNINVEKDLAYVIYTSGSTGKPKGVMIEHRSIAMTLQWRKNEYKLNGNNSVLPLVSYAFDGFVTSFFTPIIAGAKVVLLSDGETKDIFRIKEKINLHHVNHLISVPTMCHAIMEVVTIDDVKYLKTITVAGEILTSKVVEKCKDIKPDVKIINEYGPTENSVITTIMRDVKVKNSIPIGKPKDNTQVYILSNKTLNPIGIVGEICISGEGLARGYLNNEKLTLEKFTENPFISGRIMYRTGDLGRWLSDGNIEFIGRIDHQVKIRGFRIDIGEIENGLLSHQAIKEAIVIDREDKNADKYLCAYTVCNKEVTVGELREYLSKTLPEYMIPSYFIQLEKMPLNSNGKIDRKALPEPDGNIAPGIEYEEPRNEVEKTLIEMWSKALSVENIGINHNFFELGGHSLKATLLVSKIHKELNVEVPINEIFKKPTIKGISEYIQSVEKNIYEEIKIVEEKEYHEVSSAQKRMYMLQQFDLQSISYNMPGVLEVEGKLEIKRLENAFNKLIERHETLRTYFENIEGEIVQKIRKGIDFKVDYIDIEKTIVEAASDKEMISLDTYKNEKVINQEIEKLISSFIKAFELKKAPLLRVGVIRIEETKHIIMFDMHHIISDGVSMGILTKEFVALYDGKDLEEIKVQYKDFSAWQNNFLKSEKMKKQEEYWLQKFNDKIPVLNIPMDFERPSVKSFEGDNIRFKLDKELTSNLKKKAKETGSTMYMVLLSGVNILLSKYSEQEDIVIGSPIEGRPHADLEKIIGVFVNTLAIRNYPEGNKGYKEFLMEVKENALKAYENQDYQFEELVEKLNIRRDTSRNPLFDVMFTMQNFETVQIKLKNLNFKAYKQEHKISKFDLTFLASEVDEEIVFNVEYCTKLFKKSTIDDMITYFMNILKSITNDENIKLNDILLLNKNDIIVINNKFENDIEDSTHDIDFIF